MKIIIYSILLFLIVGCSSSNPERIVESYLKTEFVPNLKDPSSYEIISTEIKDTVFLAERLSGAVKYNQSKFESNKNRSLEWSSLANKFSELGNQERAQNAENEAAKYLEEANISKQFADSLEKVIPSIPSDQIDVIYFLHKYKALNGLGMLAPGSVEVRYDPNTGECEIMSSE